MQYKQHKRWKTNIFYFSVIVYLFVCIFFILCAYKSFSTYGIRFDVKSNIELTPVKAYKQYEESWNKNSYIGSNGGVSSNEKGYHPIYAVYMDFYMNNTKKMITIKAEEVYGIANLEKYKEIVKDGDNITRNLYYKQSTGEMIGVTKGGSSALNFYIQNATGLLVLLFAFILMTGNFIFAIRMQRR